MGTGGPLGSPLAGEPAQSRPSFARIWRSEHDPPEHGGPGQDQGGDQQQPLLTPGHSTRTGSVFQISLAYSRMVRSEEKRPMRATLRIAMAVQRSGSRQHSSTTVWQST